MKFEQRLEASRKKAGFKSKAAFANALGVKVERYLKWEQGKNYPSFDNLAQICKVLNVTADYLVGVTNEPTGYVIKHPAVLPGQGVESVEKSGTDQLSADEVAAVRAMLEQNRRCCKSCRLFPPL